MGMWLFRKKTRGESIREPIHGEFFTQDAVSAPGKALVREGIQNALDAQSGPGKVLVRIALVKDEEAIPVDRIADFIGPEAWKHWCADRNGLVPRKIPSETESCEFLVFEDFGTTGLEGDEKQDALPSHSSDKNDFFNFFRAEGHTDKDGTKRGSWGVGKHVFWRSSRISTVFGLTIRENTPDCPLLMGRTILRSHAVEGDAKRCYQDGYYGQTENSEENFMLPVADKGEIAKFCREFGLQRNPSNDAGLSLVVPWLDGEISENHILAAVVEDYFYPILQKKLDVIVETPNHKILLDANHLEDEIQKLGNESSPRMRPRLDLARWHIRLSDNERRKYQISGCPWKWNDEVIPEDQIPALRDAYKSGENIALRVHVLVRKKGNPDVQSFFDVCFSATGDSEQTRPCFIREGIIIPEVKPPRIAGLNALVVAEDPALAAFLRDAENPSHTEWRCQEKLKENYGHGCKTCLAFVVKSVNNIIRILMEADTEADRNILANLFPRPSMDDDQPIPNTTAKTPSPLPTPAIVRIQKVNGGFAVLPGRRKITLPTRVEIRAAYNIRSGNALGKYRPEDFRIANMTTDSRKVRILEQANNRLLVEIEDADFSLRIRGFDENRDIYVRAQEIIDAGQ